MTLTCDDWHMASPRHAGMYVESPSRTYQAKDGSTRTYRTHLLRRSFREDGKVKKETLANVSALPDSVIAALKASLSGSVLVDAGDVLEIERSLPHGHVAAAHVMASRLGLKSLLGPDCSERDLAYGLIIARAVTPALKLATTRWWADTTLGADPDLRNYVSRTGCDVRFLCATSAGKVFNLRKMVACQQRPRRSWRACPIPRTCTCTKTAARWR